ncbi:MAG: ester cyclase [Myxococcaceae bacterium]
MHDHLVHRYYEELFNQGRVELITELLAPDYVNHSPGSPQQDRGRQGVADVITALRKGVPDLHCRIEDVVSSPTAVAVRTRVSGTHLGELFGVPPTGRRFEVTQLAIEHVRDGRIVAHWRVTEDFFAALQR